MLFGENIGRPDLKVYVLFQNDIYRYKCLIETFKQKERGQPNVRYYHCFWNRRGRLLNGTYSRISICLKILRSFRLKGDRDLR